MSDLGATTAVPQAHSENDLKAVIGKVAWRLMPLIMICYLFAFSIASTSALPSFNCKAISVSRTPLTVSAPASS